MGRKSRHRTWFENGNREIDAMMRDGIAFGRHLKWFEDGSLRFSGNFKDNLQWHGHIVDVGEDGTVYWDAIFENGRYVSGIYPAAEEEAMREAGMLGPAEEAIQPDE